MLPNTSSFNGPHKADKAPTRRNGQALPGAFGLIPGGLVIHLSDGKIPTFAASLSDYASGEKVMDVLYFFKERTRFIRNFYDTAAEPFNTTIRAIEDDLPPYDCPPYSESSEPAYLSEWTEASEALEVLGRTCLSMLSPSLQLYFKAWERELGVVWEAGQKKKDFKKGFLEGYMICFEQILGISRKDCTADLALIEQVILARNCDQHPEEITTMSVRHSQSDRNKYSNLFFMNEQDRAMFSESEIADISFLDPAVCVSRDHLQTAIGETEKLADWLEEHMIAKRWGRSDGNNVF